MNHKSLVIFAFIALISACKASQTVSEGVNTHNIAAAEQLFGLSFTETERDSMQDQLRRNLRGYEERMEYSFSNHEPMALYFDPRPNGYRFSLTGEPYAWQPDTSAQIPQTRDDLAWYSIPQLAGLLVTGQITSVELAEFFIQRIEKYDPQLYAVITITRERAMEEAKRADSEIKSGKYRGVLHGIPYGVKDLLSTKDYPTTWGAAPFKNQVIDEDAEVIRKLGEAGAVLIAKLTSGALASGDYWFGGRTRNPWNLSDGASGSSAGPGAATAAGLVPFAIGSETWGSILSPAARCGITGFRPTFGFVSRHGAMTLSWSMDKLGPMARSAEDCAIVFNAIYGYDDRDRATVPYGFQYGLNPEKLRVGYVKELFDNSYQDSANDSIALEVFRKGGFELIEVKLPDSVPYSSLGTIIRAESGALFDEFTRSNLDDQMVRQDKNARPTTFRQAHFIPAVEYIEANRWRYRLIEEMDKIFKDVDVIIAPATQGPVSLVTNLTGHPAIALPNGFRMSETPSSITFIGALYRDNAVLQIAKWYQDQTEWHQKHPPQE